MELRYGVRALIRRPGFTAAVVVMLGVGTGAVAAIFGVIDRLFIHPLPFADQDRVVSVEKAWPLFYNSSGDADTVREPGDAFQALARYELGRATLGGQAAPETIRLARASSSFFSILGVPAHLGAVFSAAQRPAQGEQVAVLSHALWRTYFNQDAAVIGRTITLNGHPFTVIGVMPADFLFLVRGRKADAWIPLTPQAEFFRLAQEEGSGTMARLRPELSVEQAQARTDLAFESIRLAQPQLRLKEKDRILLIPLDDYWFGNLRSPLLMLLGAAACLFLIACANTISLMIARSADHRRDMAIRGALGAGWVQMVRQHLIEGVLLGMLGGVLGLLMAYWATEVMLAVSPTPIPRPDEVGINLRMIAFVFVIAIPAAIIPGVISSWRLSRTPLNGIVNEDPARGGSLFSARLRRVLVISEVALTMAVLINAGLLFRSFRGLMQEKLGFDTYNVLTLELAPPATRYPDSQRRAALYQQIIDRVGSLPGVAHAGTVNYLPMFSGSLIIPVKLQEREVPPELWFSWTYRVASSDYFEAMKIPVIAGRTFSDRDGAAAPRVVILDQSAAAYLTKHFFPHESLLGKHVILTFDKPTAFEIIGVAGDIRQQGLGISTYPGFYLHALQRPPAVAHLVVRTTIDPSSLSGLLRSTISAIDGDLPVSGLTLMEGHVTASVARRRFSLLLTTILGSGALLLSMLGLYSLMSHIVSGRTREIGVRMALGADAREVLRLILTQALGTVVAGTVLGILLALGTGGLIASMLVGVGTADPATFGLMTLMLVIVALVACYVPTRRAMKIAPAEALRHD